MTRSIALNKPYVLISAFPYVWRLFLAWMTLNLNNKEITKKNIIFLSKYIVHPHCSQLNQSTFVQRLQKILELNWRRKIWPLLSRSWSYFSGLLNWQVASSCFLSVQWLCEVNKSFSKGPDRNIADIQPPKNLMFWKSNWSKKRLINKIKSKLFYDTEVSKVPTSPSLNKQRWRKKDEIILLTIWDSLKFAYKTAIDFLLENNIENIEMWYWLACEQHTHFRSDDRNESAVRRLGIGIICVIMLKLDFWLVPQGRSKNNMIHGTSLLGHQPKL